jgi:hypothetical protein
MSRMAKVAAYHGVEPHAGEVPCPPYTCVESPVDWGAIDALAILTVFWIIFSFVYKGVKGPQLDALSADTHDDTVPGVGEETAG